MTRLPWHLGLSLALFSSQMALANADLALANDLYHQPGSNSCMYCHGASGHEGKVQEAADFTRPTSWRTYRGLGGAETFKKDPQAFRAKMDELLLQLIKNSAPVQNQLLKDPAFSWDAAGGEYNSQMLGLLGAPSAKWLKTRKIAKDRAAHALLEYVKSFDREGFWSGTPAKSVSK